MLALALNNVELQKIIDLEEADDVEIVQNSDNDSTYSNFQLGTKKEVELKTVLGVSWDIAADNFIFDFRHIIERSANIQITKLLVMFWRTWIINGFCDQYINFINRR